MSQRVARWHPDCGCVVDLTYDSEDPTLEHAAFVAPCPRHHSATPIAVVDEWRAASIGVDATAALRLTLRQLP